MRSTVTALLIGLAMMPVMALAQGFEDIARLEARLVAALDAEIGAPGGPAAPIDRRLRLVPCPGPAEIDPPALGAVAIRCPAKNWRIRVPLSRGASSTSSAIAPRPQPIVRRGDPVELVAVAPGFRVSAQGIAQEDGMVGERIRVKTDAKAAVLFAEVVQPGIVRLPLFK